MYGPTASQKGAKTRYVRLCTAIEVIEHPAYCDTRKADFVVRDQRVNTSDYATVLAHAMQDGKESELVHVYAISAALNVVFSPVVRTAVVVRWLVGKSVHMHHCWSWCHSTCSAGLTKICRDSSAAP